MIVWYILKPLDWLLEYVVRRYNRPVAVPDGTRTRLPAWAEWPYSLDRRPMAAQGDAQEWDGHGLGKAVGIENLDAG
jgi:hypothetical protein